MVARLIVKGGLKLYRVYRATSKKKALPHGEGIVSKKFQGRYFVDYRNAAEGMAKNIKEKADRLILKADLTAEEHKLGKKLFMKFVPDKFGPYGGGKPSRFGRLVIPKSALKKIKVDRKLTRDIRKKYTGGMINYYQDLL